MLFILRILNDERLLELFPAFEYENSIVKWEEILSRFFQNSFN